MSGKIGKAWSIVLRGYPPGPPGQSQARGVKYKYVTHGASSVRERVSTFDGRKGECW